MNNLDFLNLNTLRNYPIKDGLSRVSADELFTIPNDLIADISISAPSAGMMRLFISKVISSSDSVYLEISTSDNEVVGTFYIPYATHEAYDDYSLTASTIFPNAVGTVTIGYINDIKSQPSGEFSFNITATELLMRVYTPATIGITYLAFSDEKGNEAHLTGNVRINAEANLRFRLADNGSEKIVHMDAGNGLGLNKPCDADDLNPILTINGVPPDEEGDFHVIAQDCVSVETIENGMLIRDTCGKPCLGCTEVGTLTERTIVAENELLRIRDYVVNLENLITQLTTLVNYQCECE